jgi:hypothetical protein
MLVLDFVLWYLESIMVRKIFLGFFVLILALIGFGGPGLVDHSAHSFCPLASIFGVDCPQGSGPLALALHHALGWQGLTQAIFDFNLNLLTAFGLLALSFALFLLVSCLKRKTLFTKIRFYLRYIAVKNLVVSLKRLLAWLNRLEKRDPHLVSWGA